MLSYVFRLFAKIGKQFITHNLVYSQQSMLIYSKFYVFKMLSSSAVVRLVVRNNRTEFEFAQKFQWNVSEFTSLMIATLAFKTWFQIVEWR